jgi:quinol monooxygenase YgiN
MTCLIIRLTVKPGREPDFERLEREFSSLALEREPGTVVYDVLRQRTDPGDYVVYARFKDEAAYKAHQATEHYRRLIPQILDALGEEMDLQFFDWIG